MPNGMIQINTPARLSRQGIRTGSCSTRFLGQALRGWVAALVCVVDYRDF